MAPKCIGSCAHCFVLGVVFDLIGITVLLVGALANLHYDGQFYGDFLVYTGSIVVFLSLIWWVLWHLGNMRTTSDDLEDNKRNNLAKWVRKISTIAGPSEERWMEQVLVHSPTQRSRPNPYVHGYDNPAFDRSTDMSVKVIKWVEVDNRKQPQTFLNETTLKTF